MYSQILIVAKEVSDLIKEVPAPIWGGGDILDPDPAQVKPW